MPKTLPRAKSIEEVRAAVAAGTAAAAAEWRANSNLRGAAAMATKMEARAAELHSGATMFVGKRA